MMDRDRDELKNDPDANPDPITGAPGSHPVGTGIGAASAGAAGAAIGAMAGPIGAVIGAIVGSVGGGLAGKGVAEKLDPTVEDAYWREEHMKISEKDQPYEKYHPAYRYGWETAPYTTDREYEDIEPELEKHWSEYRGEECDLEWDEANFATREAWLRARENFRRKTGQ